MNFPFRLRAQMYVNPRKSTVAGFFPLPLGIPFGVPSKFHQPRLLPGWKALGRHVLKGQKAISLVMPLTCKKRDEENQQAADSHDSRKSERLTRFVFRPNWFVLSQTEGNDVAAATAPNWNVERALSALGITRVEFATMNGNAQGYAAPGKQIAINPVAALPHKTMFHELAHVVLGHTEEGQLSDDEQIPRSLREVEAEHRSDWKAKNLHADTFRTS